MTITLPWPLYTWIEKGNLHVNRSASITHWSLKFREVEDYNMDHILTTIQLTY